MKKPCLYIITNQNHSKFSAGVTEDLARHIFQLKKSRSNNSSEDKPDKPDKLVWYKSFSNMETAHQEHKRLLNSSEEAIFNLIRQLNPQWRDLYKKLK